MIWNYDIITRHISRTYRTILKLCPQNTSGQSFGVVFSSEKNKLCCTDDFVETSIKSHEEFSLRCKANEMSKADSYLFYLNLNSGEMCPHRWCFPFVVLCHGLTYQAIARYAIPLALLIVVSYQFRPATQDPSGVALLGNSLLGIVAAVGFVVGALCSALSGYVSMWVAARSNIRVASAARRSYGEALVVCFRGGAFSAVLNLTLCVAGEICPVPCCRYYPVCQ